eukprot:Skav218657  [mRNA]  locus=scaffold365:797251:799296:- [translate_table: standard]
MGGERLEGYETAVEEPQMEGGDDLLPNGAGPDVQTLLDQLLAQAEITQRAVTGMKDQVAALPRLEARLSQLEQGNAPAARRATPSAAAPQLFQQDPPGLAEDVHDRLRDLAGRGPGRMGDLGAQPGHGPARSKVPLMPTAEDGGIVDVEQDGDELDGEPIEGGTLEKLLASQTKLLVKLVASKTQQSDPLAILGAGSADGGDEAPRASGVKGIAARQVLMDSFRKHPAKVVSLFRERLALARRKGSAREVEPRDLWWHFQETVPLGSHRTLTHLVFISAAMFEAQERKDFARLQMLVVLQACFIEQAAYDGGALRLAHLLTCLEEPPWGQTELRKGVKADLPHGHLSDPRPRQHAGQARQASSPCKSRRRCRSSQHRGAQEDPEVEAQEEAFKSRRSRRRGMNVPPFSSVPSQPRTVTGVGDQKSKPLPDFVSSASYGTDIFKTLFSSRTPLGNFCHQMMKLPMTEDSYCVSKQLWPCPIPASLPRPSAQLVGRRRSRYKLRVTVREHLRIFVATSNWLCLGRPKTCTSSRLPLSAAQSRMLLSLEHSLRLHYRLSSGASSGLDRSLGKFSSLSESLQQLLVATESVRHDLDTYSRVRGGDRNFEAHSGDEEAFGSTVPGAPPAHPVSAGVSMAGRSGQCSTALPIDPDRIRFKQVPAFNAERSFAEIRVSRSTSFQSSSA